MVDRVRFFGERLWIFIGSFRAIDYDVVASSKETSDYIVVSMFGIVMKTNRVSPF